jgi:hypothetical protein
MAPGRALLMTQLDLVFLFISFFSSWLVGGGRDSVEGTKRG